MFIKGSRYRNLPESSPVNAQGERLRGKDLRVITRSPGQFLHTVRDGDRLDLVAFKYYGDSTKWWQITDANPAPPFPIDLIDRSPIVEELLVVSNTTFAKRFDELLTGLKIFGDVSSGQVSFFDHTIKGKPDFLETTVVVTYTPSPSKHQQIVDKINASFHFLRSFAWDKGGNTAEAFTLEDPSVKSKWRALADGLSSAPGMLEARSSVTETTLRVLYNSELLSRETILAMVKSAGFALEPESLALSRVGEKIVIPPNEII